MKTIDIIDDSFHGTPRGYADGCRGAACPAVISCGTCTADTAATGVQEARRRRRRPSEADESLPRKPEPRPRIPREMAYAPSPCHFIPENAIFTRNLQREISVGFRSKWRRMPGFHGGCQRFRGQDSTGSGGFLQVSRYRVPKTTQRPLQPGRRGWLGWLGWLGEHSIKSMVHQAQRLSDTYHPARVWCLQLTFGTRM